jgi:hypothetical protein
MFQSPYEKSANDKFFIEVLNILYQNTHLEHILILLTSLFTDDILS